LTFVDRIADAHDIAEVFDLVNEFIGALQSKPDIHEIPFALRPARISTADDLAYWLNLLSDEIKRLDTANKQIPDAMFALHAVLETALQRLRGDWYH
jgi:hypothetical protein